jgi:hypothetical protein
MVTDILLRAVSFSARRPVATLICAIGLALAAMAYSATHFDMTTDTGDMISDQTEWRRIDAEIGKAFPETTDAIVVVVDGKTPELAEDAAARLTAAVSADEQDFYRVRREDGGEYFDRNGLLFGSTEDVRGATNKLIDAQPLLGGLAFDSSLHGIAKALETAASGAADDPANAAADDLANPLSGLDRAISAKLDGKAAYFSWLGLFASGKGDLAPPLRQVVSIQPKLDYGNIQPGARAVEAVLRHAAKLGLDEAHGVKIGITGEVPLADEEFGSIEENIGYVGLLMGASMLLTLWFATRAFKTVVAIAATILVGLIVTLAGGLLAVGKLTLLSIAFIPLFVGLGVDFGIQVTVRFNSERWHGAGLVEALERAAAAIGAPILLATGAIVLALGAFLPTDFIGVAELGVISGFGMIVALLLNVTLLPALLITLKPPVPRQRVGFAAAAPIDRWLVRNRKRVIVAFVAAMAVSIALLPLVRFDFNPLHLRDANAPAMKTLADLTRDPTRTPNTLSLLTPNIAAANEAAKRLGRLPQVRDAITLDSLIPSEQQAKLPLIEDAALLLDATINPFDTAPPADDVSTVAALHDAESQLRRLAVVRPGPVGTSAAKLAFDFNRLAKAPPDVRKQVEAMLVQPLIVTLNKIRTSLQPSAITRDTLPADIVSAWIAHDGKALVQISPSGDASDNAVIERFTSAVRKIAPEATGMPVATQEAAHTVAGAFLEAGALALVLVSLLLIAVLRDVREVAFTLAPVVLSGFLTLGCCVLIGQPLNFANIIAFPLLFGVGVAFHIYFVMAWRSGTTDLLQTSLARAVLFSALATGSAFGALWFSDHPGTASMGLILMISLVWTLICALIFEPALLGPPRADGTSDGEVDSPLRVRDRGTAAKTA